MKQVFYFFVALFVASPALAEVCDKERPRWNPNSGKINQFEEMLFFFISPLGICLVLLIAATFYFKRRWLLVSCAALTLLVAILKVTTWLWLGDDIIHAAYREGCRASPLLTIGVLALLSIGLFQHGRPRVT